MLANNETGIIQPIAELGRLVRAHGSYLICDTVQALGKIDFDFATLGADAIFVSAHKIGGLPGVGAIIHAPGANIGSPLIRGGAQESNFRAGTENLPGIAAFGAASRVLAQKSGEERLKIKALRDFMEARLCSISKECAVAGASQPRLGNTTYMTVQGRKAETLVIALDLAGIAVGAGSACTSGKLSPSHVLTAMGKTAEEAQSKVAAVANPIITGLKSKGIEEKDLKTAGFNTYPVYDYPSVAPCYAGA
ncbi:MAG: aminotransferase class V-fold PLP-dependent enzyme, partial [Pseudomonadota bacterium]